MQEALEADGVVAGDEAIAGSIFAEPLELDGVLVGDEPFIGYGLRTRKSR